MEQGMVKLVLLDILLRCLATSVAINHHCCKYSSSIRRCRDACDQLAVTTDPGFVKKLTIGFPVFCPRNNPSLDLFWNCVENGDSYVGVRGEWVGLKCCDYAVGDECRSRCLQVKSSRESLELHCRRDIEADLYGCIFRYQRKKRCCSKSENLTSQCRHMCAMSFQSEVGPSKDNLRSLEKHCPVEVQQCTKNYSDSLRKESADTLLCCDKSNSEKCRNDCRKVMQSHITDREKIDQLVEACGKPIPREPMWKCFISRSDSPRPTPPRAGPDLQCCPKAISANCRQLCKKLYSRPWESSMNWKYFQQLCEYNPEESDLNICLQEVRAPCKMGCDGLSFCTNFNNRPTELFHSCNARADSVAKAQMSEWAQGLIRLPIADIPILNIESCEPEKWKAVACALEIKPCSTDVGDSTICREDCVHLLQKCADHSRFSRGMTVERLCDMFSPSHRQHDCISLEKYTATSDQPGTIAELTQPCHPNPCPNDYLCVINRDKCSGSRCLAHKCLPGCKVGDVGDSLVHIGQRVRIPDWDRGEGCFRTCACTSTGKLQYCIDLPCMDGSNACKTAGQVKVHGSHFKIDCNFCTCYNGNVTCTKRQCKSTDKSDDNNRKFTGLPCNCEKHFMPVCAPNGRTYPNTCLAKCMGHSDSRIQFAACKARDPCASNPCKRNERCVRASRVCITSPSEYECPQYECVAPFRRCQERRGALDAYASDGHHYVNHRRLNSASRRPLTAPIFFGYDVDANTSDPVCDTDGIEYESICHLRKRQKTKLAYRGHCKDKCSASPKSPVCGQDIVTYENECSASAERVLVDYESGCHEANLQGMAGEENYCELAKCRKLANPTCDPVVPPGACCPICGGMLRVLYSQTHVDAISRTAIKGPVTVRDVLRSLRRHINVKECDIYGHLTIEGDIAILTVPIVEKPTSLQVEACVREAEGIGRLINERSPILALDGILSTLTAAEVHGSKEPGNGASSISLEVPHFSYIISTAWRFLLHKGSYYEEFRDDTHAPFFQWMAILATTHYVVTQYVYPVG